MEYKKVDVFAKKWGLPRKNVSAYCKAGRIPGAKQEGGRWYIPEDAEKPADKRTARQDGYLSAAKTAERWGVTSPYVSKLAKDGGIPGAIFIGGRWHIPEDAEKPARRKKAHIDGYFSSEEIAEKWGVTEGHVCRLCREGDIPDALFFNGCWNIPMDAKRPPQMGPEGTISLAKAAKLWGVVYPPLLRRCKAGKVIGAVNVDGFWFVPEKTEHPTEGYLSSAEIAERWNVTKKHLMLMCRNGRIPGAKLIGRIWYIPENAEKPADGRKNNGRKKKQHGI